MSMSRLMAALSLVLLGSSCGSPPTDARSPEDAAATESGGHYEPPTEDERRLAAKIGALPTGQKLKDGEVRFSASEKYQAASGYECRKVFVENKDQQTLRLVCGEDGQWFFVPDINGGEDIPVDAPLPQPEHKEQDAEKAPTSPKSEPTPASPDTKKRGAESVSGP